VKFEWHSSHQQAFEKIKIIIGTEVLLCSSIQTNNKPFHLYTDSSDYQLATVIMQDKKPIAFYSQKLNTTQKLYTTTERELLSAIEISKGYKNILLGYYQPIILFTDHKNNNFNGLKASDCVLRLLFVVGDISLTFILF
jgi:hypothetical protein